MSVSLLAGLCIADFLLESRFSAGFCPPPFFDTRGRLQRGEAETAGVRLYVPVHSGLCLVRSDNSGGFEPVLLTKGQVAPFLAPGTCLEAWLGTAAEGSLASLAAAALTESASNGGDGQGTAEAGFWLLDLSHLPQAPDFAEASICPGACWLPLRDRAGPSVCDKLVADDYAALLATARGLALWHGSCSFCAACGGKTAPHRSGRQRRCAECGTRHRPRLDPSVIVLVVQGSRCLLGRKAAWPEGRYSTLAGFVEFGETLEECIVREVHEEAGVSVDRASVRFVASQPWLFPRSLMFGFIVEAAETSVTVDHEELQDAAWFEAAEVRASLAASDASGGAAGAFHVPSRVSLGRTVIDTWLRELEDTPG